MNVWLWAIILLVPALAVPVVVAMRESVNHRMAAVQLAGTFAALMVALMTFAFDQPSFIDLSLCLVFLSIPGTLLFTMFMERWL